jgi:beta-galactosidase
MHTLACLQTIACGSDTIQYFQFRAGRGSFEQHHGAVVNHTGRDDTRTFREVSEVGQLLKTLAPVAGSSAVAKSAIIYDWDNIWAIKDMAGAARENKKYQEVCVEHFDALRRLGQDPDVISSTESFEGYDLICAPMLYMLKPGVAQKLRDFVSAGGTLVTTWLTGYVDETTLTFLGGFPGDGLMDVLGVEAAELDTLYPGQGNAIHVGDETYKVEDFCELLIIRSPETKVLGTYAQDFYQDEPAITVHPYGEGKSVHVAAHVEKQCLIDLYSGLYSMMGQPAELLPEGIEVHHRVNGDSTYTFWLNFSEDEVELPALKNNCRDLLTGEELKAGTRETLGAYGYLIVEEL